MAIDINVFPQVQDVDIIVTENITTINVSTFATIDPQEYDLNEFTNTDVNPFVRQNSLPSPITNITEIANRSYYDLQNLPSIPSAISNLNQIATRLYSDLQGLPTLAIIDEQIEISANSNVLDAWNGKTILFTASCTITVPATLINSLMFAFRTLAGVTVTWAITSPFVWNATPAPTPQNTVGNFMRRGSTNTIFLDI